MKLFIGFCFFYDHKGRIDIAAVDLALIIYRYENRISANQVIFYVQ